MPANRSVQLTPSGNPEDYRNNNHLTTIKEVRTYQIRPSEPGLRSSLMNLNNSNSAVISPAGSLSSSNSNSKSSSPDEFRHRRDASLDSSVSWQSASTNSSGYSSSTAAMSSSTSTLDRHGSQETLIAPAQKDQRERSNTTEERRLSTAERIEKESQDGTPQRTVSVSEMVRSYSETKIAPAVPPKPRYSFLPAQSPDTVSTKRTNGTPSMDSKVVKKPAVNTASNNTSLSSPISAGAPTKIS